MNIFGGSLQGLFNANSGSTVNISGGFVNSDGFNANSGSTVNISGDAFQRNGSAINNLSASFGGSESTDLFTGVLADGTVFIFAGEKGVRFEAGTTTLQTTAVTPSANPGVLSTGTLSKGLRAGETLTVTGSGALSDSFAVVGGTLNVESGTLGFHMSAAFSEVNISGGNVGDRFSAFSGSTINITGGSVDSVFIASSSSTVNISGGSVGVGFLANSGSIVNISGGSIGDAFKAASDSTVNLVGTSFILDGLELTELIVGEAFTITDRDVTLTGTLADGSVFDFELKSISRRGESFFDPDATLTVTLIPAPAAAGMFGLAAMVASRRRR